MFVCFLYWYVNKGIKTKKMLSLISRTKSNLSEKKIVLEFGTEQLMVATYVFMSSILPSAKD